MTSPSDDSPISGAADLDEIEINSDGKVSLLITEASENSGTGAFYRVIGIDCYDWSGIAVSLKVEGHRAPVRSCKIRRSRPTASPDRAQGDTARSNSCVVELGFQEGSIRISSREATSGILYSKRFES